MPVPADWIGRTLGPRETAVTPRLSLAYAAAIGAEAPCYTDDARPGGIVAPPPFCVCLEWPLVGDQLYAQLRAAAGEALNSVHVLQDSHFHRVIRPGDRLRTSGRVVDIRATRAGAYVGARFDTSDAASGQAVVTTWWGAMLRGMEVAGEGRAREAAPELRADAGLPMPPAGRVEIPVARLLPHVYSECARIWNPIHTERAAALARGLPDIILHGTATWALAGQALLAVHGGAEPARLLRLGGRFKGMVLPGTTIVLEYAPDPADPSSIAFVVRNAAGELAVTHGVARFAAA